MRNSLLCAFFGLFALMLSTPASPQSISGNVNSGISASHLGFANVDIFRDGKLIANILTDYEGNFKINLDTGTYVCEITYVGHKTITREIVVRADEKSDFTLDEDKSSKFSAIELNSSSKAAEKRTMARRRGGSEGVLSVSEDALTSYDSDFKIKNLTGPQAINMWNPVKKNDTAKYGKLTAGEINDFSKYEMWTDLNEGVLNNYQSSWNILPKHRYMLQLITHFGLPLADVKIELVNDDSVIFRARTDNTGKAELWASIRGEIKHNGKPYNIHISYNGNIEIIKNAIPFEKGINTYIINTQCIPLDNVDIAFVVDATGSMHDEIDYLKLDLNNVVYHSKEISTTLNFRFANVFYRDHGDAYLTSHQDFTRVLSESIAFTNRHNAAGGGDYPEAVDVALDTAINSLSWSENARARIIFLVLDAPPHNKPDIQEKLRTLILQAAEKGIRIVTVTGSGINKSTEYLMRCLALGTNGSYTFITNHSGIGNPHIEPSTDSYQVEILNDLLVRIIKSYTYMPDCMQHLPEMDIHLPDSVVDLPKPPSSVEQDITEVSKLQWKYYPNPTEGIINIIANTDIKELYISDLSGKALLLVKDIKAEEVRSIDISMFATGIYLIRYPVGKQWVSGKIVLIRD